MFEHTCVVSTSSWVKIVDLDAQRNPTALPFPFRCSRRGVGSARQLRLGREFAPRAGLGSLSLDLKVGKNDGWVHSFADVRPDADVSFAYTRHLSGHPEALARLDVLAEGADCLLGHNTDFEVPYLSAANPSRGFCNSRRWTRCASTPWPIPATPTTS